MVFELWVNLKDTFELLNGMVLEITCSILVDALCKKVKVKEAKMVIVVMMKGVKPDVLLIIF